MRIFKFTRSIVDMMQDAKDYLANLTDQTVRTRVMIVLRMFNGETATSLSHEYGYSITAITAWARKVDNGGFKVLDYKPPVGRNMRLTTAQYLNFKSCLRQKPENFGLKEYPFWSGPAVQLLLKNKFNVDFCLCQCQRLLRKGEQEERLSLESERDQEGRRKARLRPNRLSLTGAAATAAIASLEVHNVTENAANIDLSEYDPRLLRRPDITEHENNALKELNAKLAKVMNGSGKKKTLSINDKNKDKTTKDTKDVKASNNKEAKATEQSKASNTTIENNKPSFVPGYVPYLSMQEDVVVDINKVSIVKVKPTIIKKIKLKQ